MSIRQSRLERENLEAHVDLCAERYRVLEEKFTNLEDRVNDSNKRIEEKIDNNNERLEKKIDRQTAYNYLTNQTRVEPLGSSYFSYEILRAGFVAFFMPFI